MRITWFDKLLNKIFCRHDYQITNVRIKKIDTGSYKKQVTYKCEKCGRKKKGTLQRTCI